MMRKGMFTRCIFSCSLAAAVSLCACSLVTEDPPAAANMCESKVRREVDPVALQSWATNLLAAHLPWKTNYAGPFEPPVYLKHIWSRRQPSVYIQGGYNGEDPYVRVFWGGGGAGHWGLLVGSSSFSGGGSPEARVLWTNGMYFFRDFH
jgi:hypothetical protein